MTKKDYELIANVIYSLYLGHNSWTRNAEQVTSRFADRLAEHNPKFDRTKFLKACGIE